MLIQIIIILFILFAVSRVVLKYKESNISLGELALWLFFWLAAAAVVLWPGSTSFLANLLGVGRGADLIVYLSIILLFYIVFRIFVKLEKIERDITKIVREVGLKDYQDKK